MKSRWLLALVPLAGALVTYAALAAPAAGTAEGFYVVENCVALGAAALGATVAALAFGRGEYMGRAWGLTALCYGLLFAGTLVFGASTNTLERETAAWVAVANGALTLVANAAAVAGSVLMARAWAVAGLDVLVPRRTRVAAVVVSTLLALALAGSGAWVAVQDVLGGHLGGLEDVASALGDVTCLALLGPILLTAVTLRGGSLAWPWALLALSSVGWLLFDGALLVGAVFELPAATLRPVEEAFRMVACLGTFSAGLLQRSVLTEQDAPAAPQPAALGAARAA